MVEPDSVVDRAGETEADLLLQLTAALQHDVARVTVAARLVLAVVAGEVGVAGPLTAGATVRVVGEGGAGEGGRAGEGGLLASPVLADLLTAAELSVVRGLAAHSILSLGECEGSAADLSFAGVDLLSWVMQEVTVGHEAPDSFTHC